MVIVETEPPKLLSEISFRNEIRQNHNKGRKTKSQEISNYEMTDQYGNICRNRYTNTQFRYNKSHEETSK